MIARQWIASVLLLSIMLTGCSSEDDPQAQIEAMLAEAVAAAEDRDTGDVLAFVDDNFSDNYDHSKAELRRMLQGYFLANQQINIFTLIDKITMTGRDSAEVILSLATTGRPVNEEDWTAFKADMQQLTLSVVRDGDDWKVLHAQWQNRY